MTHDKLISEQANDLVLAISGASGAAYGVRLLDVFLSSGCRVHLTISPSGQSVLAHELGALVDLHHFQLESLLGQSARDQSRTDALGLFPGRLALNSPEKIAAVRHQVHYHHYQNMMAPIASGSMLTRGMVVCPCSGGTLSAIAHGSSQNLLHRAADVHVKERRTLIVVPRETPLSLIQLDNMRRCVESGVVVLPASPGFYHAPRQIADLVDFVVGRICDHLGIAHHLHRRWGEPE